MRKFNMILTMQKNYKPGDMPPEGYLAWHEWAEVQSKAGLKSVACSNCGLWRYPQELSDKVDKVVMHTKKGKPKTVMIVTCKKCAEKDK